MKKGTILENIKVEKLVFGGKGFSRFKSENPDLDGKALFISGGVIPGSIVNLKILKNRKDYIETQCMEVIKVSPIEKKHPNNIYGDQAGSKWVNIPYEEQLKIKATQVEESLFHIKTLQPNLKINDIIPSPLIDGYRNKIEFSFGKYISEKEHRQEHFNVGFHKQGEFSKVEDFDGTILIDELMNKIYKEIKDYSKSSGLPAYDQFNHQGFFRHILLRRAFFTNQVMIIFSINHKYLDVIPAEAGIYKKGDSFIDIELQKATDFLISLTKKYSQIKSIYLSLNDNRSDTAIGELKLIYGEKFIEEKLLGITFNISPKSFFQTNSYGAEKLYSEVLNQIDKLEIKDFTVLDLYAGTGTIGMIFAKYAKKVISVELISDASKDGEENAKKNDINNMEFVCEKVEDFLKNYLNPGVENKTPGLADLLIIDPPRAGMHPNALPNILKFQTKNIIYVSCNPATLSRDLEFILKNSTYKISSITPVDMFPHTPHIETVVKLEL
ncbi:MAG: 23S rRNA (uracil(1939)-C(5))-methyltransferase RlmD [Candidatus Gracilibacteria bacterium]